MPSNSRTSRHLSIAILGTRGIPAAYGGFETFAEELSKRLVERGHSVTVFCRTFLGKNSNAPHLSSFHGVSLRYACTIAQKYLETPVHAFTCNCLLLTDWVRQWFSKKRKYDVALLCNAANSPFAFMIRGAGIPLAINVDGIERHRSKWNALGKAWYRLGEWSSTVFASKVIGDAKVICEYYKEVYGTDSVMIPYGATVVRRPAGETLQEFGLKSNGYILYVSRLEPENNALGVIQAYKKLVQDPLLPPLVIVGDAPYSDEYKASLRKAAEGANVIFTGYQFGKAYQELQSNCLCYIQATEVGGTHPALVEAMAYGNAVIANGTPENTEVVGDGGLLYAKNDFHELSKLMKDVLSSLEQREALSAAALKRVHAHYSWDAVTDLYEDLFFSLA